GEYTIVASTFDPGKVGNFVLTVRSSTRFTCDAIPLEGEGMYRKTIEGHWELQINAMGSKRGPEFFLNPQFWITATAQTRIRIRLQAPAIKPSPALNITLFQRDEKAKSMVEVASSGPYIDWIQGVVLRDFSLYAGGAYAVVFSTWKPVSGSYTAFMYTDKPVDVRQAEP
ncbi:cysteine protease, partial [Rhizophlyctis rosea]